MPREDVNAASLLNPCTFLVFDEDPVNVPAVHSLAVVTIEERLPSINF